MTGTVTESYLVERLRELEEEVEDKDARLKELRQAMAALPSPESVALEKERLRKEHKAQLERERAECVFQSKVATDSRRKLPPIPREGCHPIQSKAATLTPGR